MIICDKPCAPTLFRATLASERARDAVVGLERPLTGMICAKASFVTDVSSLDMSRPRLCNDAGFDT